MNRKINKDYLELKKNINSYVDKYPSPDKKWNTKKLRELKKLEPMLGSPEVDKKYYKIRDEIVLANGGFAMKYVTRYNSIMSDESCIGDLFQEATIGLIETIDAFTLSKDTSFTTYAYFHVRKRIVDFIKKNKLVKAPRNIARNMKIVNDAQDTLFSIKRKTPNAREVTQYLRKEKGIRLKEGVVDNIMILLELNSSGSEDSFISEYKDQVACDETSEVFRNMELNIMSYISKLDEDTQKAIYLRFGIGREHPHTPEEVQILSGLDLSELTLR